MIIDCEGCVAGPAACGDCVVTFVLEVPRRRGAGGAGGDDGRVADVRERPPVFELDEAERAALGTLSQLRLVPPLRMAEGG
ncbi:hypothetical protein [Cellulomonas palmilytica]|uniref:hypothetical protein n=1 Tax=Cellulomonas palmilytica TaxID=2608402 RepID=UPI001F2C5F6B|nr:hypothetical protein [Cellulomonas palmilytica]UJP39213.1 hypothetical protein F1D97_12795 [Cellulomonas palmilytica]